VILSGLMELMCFPADGARREVEEERLEVIAVDLEMRVHRVAIFIPFEDTLVVAISDNPAARARVVTRSAVEGGGARPAASSAARPAPACRSCHLWWYPRKLMRHAQTP